MVIGPHESWKISQANAFHGWNPIEYPLQITVCQEVFIFERNKTELNELVILSIPEEATGTSSAKHYFRDAELLRCIKREGHKYIRNDATDARDTSSSGVVKVLEEVPEGPDAVEFDGAAEGGSVLGGVRVGGSETVGYGFEAERGEPVKGAGPVGA
uniref:Uncharacterized protein n=1 Tax=Opuntia streptacantha TaxID=393608 RepID=A0A7C9ATG1_OPUST